MEQAFEHQQMGTLRTFKTHAEADMLAITLIANGIPAHVHKSGSQYPSLDWVEGIKVVVAADDLERAHAIILSGAAS